ncbi:hypothetical protein [Brevibacillus reuszeri]|uniref:hypothetical protein n=1 Tax=Brevibacillus reuszeri TaxID=54915 RepID=UPI003D21D1D6
MNKNLHKAKESPIYTIFGAIIIFLTIFIVTGGNIPFLEKTEAAVKHLRYQIRGIEGMPEDLRQQYDKGSSFLTNDDKMYIVIKSEGPEFSHVTSVKQEVDKVVVSVNRYRNIVGVYTIPPFLIEIDKSSYPIVVIDNIIQNVYPGKQLKKEWDQIQSKMVADFFSSN